jgi:hypothetical protein
MRRSLVIAASVAFAVLIPATGRAQLLLEPPEERLEGPRELEDGRLPNRKLLAAGAPAILVPYVASLMAAAAVPSASSAYLLVPIAGPWMTLAMRECPCDAEFLSGTALVVDGVFQAAGLIAIGRAFFVPEREKRPVGITVDVGLNGLVTKGTF